MAHTNIFLADDEGSSKPALQWLLGQLRTHGAYKEPFPSAKLTILQVVCRLMLRVLYADELVEGSE